MLRLLSVVARGACMAIGMVGAVLASERADIDALIQRGEFTRASSLIDQRLRDETDDRDGRARLRWQREWMRRMRLDFPLQQSDVLRGLQQTLPDITENELWQWKRDGYFDLWFIDGEERYFARSVANLFELNDAARQRRSRVYRGGDEGPLYASHPHHRAVIAAANEDNPYVLPVTLRIVHRITVAANAIPAGETLRAWLPYPREIEHVQPRVELINASNNKKLLAENRHLQRTIYFEAVAKKNTPTEFEVSYAVTRFAVHHKIDPARAYVPTHDESLRPYLREQGPHIQFTPALRAYNQRLVGDEKNPYHIAKKIFENVSAMPWIGAWEYSLIPNISEYLMQRQKGDCGQKSLLMITLLRMNGIPAQWQSGWEFSDTNWDTMHDWTWFYLAPYGWMPLDSTHGVLVDSDPHVQYFYLGGMDAYRVAFNDDISQPLSPEKYFVRSETVDSQRGEVEWVGGNLYFDQWQYDLKWEIIKN